MQKFYRSLDEGFCYTIINDVVTLPLSFIFRIALAILRNE